MSEGVEWALHTCLDLAWAGEGEAVPAARLAAHHGLPAPYLNKQLQALVKAGVLVSLSGPRGGFRLARPPERITVLEVVTAIEGPEEAFRCAQILRATPGADQDVDYRRTCAISQAMRRAELAWRRELAERTLGELRDTVERGHPGTGDRVRDWLTAARS